jgi:2-polyprenyl-6-methoxyphenol hydroxylase-like FAD-dependent oxidoreductase
MKNQVLIVGAGPVGMTAASELARYGVSVRIVDKAPHRTDKSKALVLWSRTLELLDRGPGGAVPFIEAGFKAHAVNLVAGDGQVKGHIRIDSVKTPYPYGLMLPQSDTERLLEERLAGLGVTVERQTEVLGFTATHSGVDAKLRRADGQEESVAAEWLLGSDGAHSTVRHTLGAPFSGETMNSDWMLADVHMTGYPFPDDEASVYWHKDGAFVIFPISPGRYRVLADLPATSGPMTPDPSLAEVQTIIDRRGPGGLKAFDPIWLAGFRINGRKVSQYRFGRAFLLGDAAHVHSPAGGQGMNTGMQDAFNLSWKLAMVIQGRCAEHLLDSYSPERSAVGDEVLKMAGRLTAIATLKNPVLQSLRNVATHFMFGLSPVQNAFADSVTQVTIGYPDSPLNQGTGLHATPGPKPGERVAPCTDEAPLGSGPKPLFSLFAEDDPSAAALIARFPDLLDTKLRAPFNPDGIWLVRPDGYVCCFSKSMDEIAHYLDKLKSRSVGQV